MGPLAPVDNPREPLTSAEQSESDPAPATIEPHKDRARRAPAKVIAIASLPVMLGFYEAADKAAAYTSRGAVSVYVALIAPHVAGQVNEIFVQDNAIVQPGQPPFRPSAFGAWITLFPLTRTRRSTEKAFDISDGARPGRQSESVSRQLGNPSRSTQVRSCSSVLAFQRFQLPGLVRQQTGVFFSPAEVRQPR